MRAVAWTPCRHCGTAIEGDAPFCCAGCETAYAIISGAGLEAYYARREAAAPRPVPRAGLDRLPVEALSDGQCALRVALDGLRCASCVWVVERVLERTPGVTSATVSYGSGRARVVFDPAVVEGAVVAHRIADLGYVPRPVGDVETRDRDLLVRLGVAAFAAMNVMLMSASVYAGWWSGMDERFAALFRWASLAVATPAAIWSAAPFFEGAWRGLRHGVLHMDLPVSLGIAVLYGSAVVATVLGHDGYLDSLTMLVALLLLGRVLEARGRREARAAAESLAASLPRTARRASVKGVEHVGVESLVPGDRLLVGVGEEVGADGVVVIGAGQLQMALLSGESAPVAVGAGAQVCGGALVVDGAIEVRVDAVGRGTLVERMAEQLREAADRPVVIGWPDRIAPWFTAATLLVAGGTFAGWTLVAGAGAAVAPTVAVLVVACPCALALAQPLAVAAGLGAAARRGVLVRDGSAMLRLGEVDAVAFDKTGTLTEGELRVLDAPDAALRVAAALERYSIHPVANAIVAEASRRGIPLPSAEAVHEVPGRGIEGVVDHQPVRIASAGAGRVRVDAGDASGEVALGDTVRADAASTVAALHDLGLRVCVLSGDHPDVVARVAEATGVDDAAGGVDPLGKASQVAAWQRDGRRVLFAGDGVNDGPALHAAHVGLAMGTGAASSLLVADGVVSERAIGPVLAALRAGRAVRAAIRGNVIRSVAYNAVAVAAAAVGWVNPLVAAVLMPLSSSLVLLGARRVERTVAEGR